MPKAEMLSKLLAKASGQFAKAGFNTPDLDAKILLKHLTKYTSAQLISNANAILQTDKVMEFHAFVERRLKHEPVHRIIGYREFFGRDFFLSEETLIPRPDTETLVEEVIKKAPAKVLEIGTGSGAIAVSLACELPSVEIIATDVSLDALNTATRNAAAHSVSNKIKFTQANLFDGIEDEFDAIVSNPPYIASGEIKDLQMEVRLFDPRLALDGGEDGFEFYKAILHEAKGVLKPGGMVFLEIGLNQEEEVSRLAKSSGFQGTHVIKDLNDIKRVVITTL